MLNGSDLYHVENKYELSGYMDSLMELYQPIIGSDAILLYLTLNNQKDGSFKDLGILINKDLTTIERSRIKLEEVNLLATYQKSSNYILELKLPQGFNAFLNHEVFGRLLIKTMGKDYHQACMKRYPQVSKVDYVNISATIQKDFLNSFTPAMENAFQANKSTKKIASFTKRQLFTGVSNFVFPLEQRTTTNINLIMEIADLYDIPLDTIKTIAFRSIDSETGLFDENKFKSRARRQKTEKEVNHPYDMSCSRFLSQYQSSGNVPDSSKKFLEDIKGKYDLKNEVINVVIEYVLKNYNMDLNKGIIEAIVSKFDRLKVSNYQKALDSLKAVKTTNNYKSKKVKVETPEWITSNPVSKKDVVDNSQVEDDKLKDMLRGLSND